MNCTKIWDPSDQYWGLQSIKCQGGQNLYSNVPMCPSVPMYPSVTMCPSAPKCPSSYKKGYKWGLTPPTDKFHHSIESRAREQDRTWAWGRETEAIMFHAWQCRNAKIWKHWWKLRTELKTWKLKVWNFNLQKLTKWKCLNMLYFILYFLRNQKLYLYKI